MTALTVNGVAVDVTAYPSAEAAVGHELLRQRAVQLGLAPAGASQAAADAAIERLLHQEIAIVDPTAEECRRYYEAHLPEFTSGELVAARHILFQVTPRVHVPALRARAELTLAKLASEPQRFAALAGELSNCPSGRHGGNLGQLGRGDTVPEFEQALFNGTYTGVYPQLVRTRFGFHILCVERREPGRTLPFEVVQGRILDRLSERMSGGALARYVRQLAASAAVSGIEIDLEGALTAAPHPS
jgi:peptidyl-prolyl cis-trans isomerase C